MERQGRGRKTAVGVCLIVLVGAVVGATLVATLDACSDNHPVGQPDAHDSTGNPLAASKPSSSLSRAHTSAGLTSSQPRVEPLSSRGGPPPAQGAVASRPPEHFNGRIPPDLPPFPGGIDGTEFFPDPFFYGEETWDGLEIRLQLYLAYQHKDLAVVAVARNRIEDALNQYRQLEQKLSARPVEEAILHDIHGTLIDWARRSQCVLLLRLTRFDEASACLKRVSWGTSAGDGLWHRYLEAELKGTLGSPSGSVTELEDPYRRLIPGPPWTPHAVGPAPTMAARHRDRLDRLRAYVVWFDPLATQQPWGTYGPAETQQSLWARAIAVTLAAHETPADRRTAISALMKQLENAPDIAVDASTIEHVADTEGHLDMLDALVAAESAVQTRGRLEPRTSAELLQGMPTGDSYLDVLGQAGSPPVGRTEKLALDDPQHRAWTERYVDAINKAIAGGHAGDISSMLHKMIQELNTYPFDSRYFNIKRVRNEGVRLLVLTGQPDQALSLLHGFFPLQDLDFRVPCRKGVLEAMRGRILLEAGRLDEARDAFAHALAHTKRWLGYMDRYRGTRTGPVGPPVAPAAPGESR